MPSFVVFGGVPLFADGQAAGSPPGPRAYLFGPEDVPIAGDIMFQGGLIRCAHGAKDNAGLALQAVVERPPGPGEALDGPARDPLGVVFLHTCLLPERDEPYLLSLELARRRIMMFVNKLEDWGLFDLPADDPALARFERARRAFTEALVSQREGNKPGTFSARADRLANSALALAVEAGERLAMIHAQRQLAARGAGAAYKEAVRRAEAMALDVTGPDMPVKSLDGIGVLLPGQARIGCTVNPVTLTEPLKGAALAACDFINLPMRWSDMEPTEGTYSFTKTDQWIEWAVRTAKLPVFAGPILDLRASAVPEWLHIWENDYETLRELVYEHVRQIVTRYRRTVARWTVASGLPVNDNFSLAFEQMLDLTRVCVLVVRKLHPQARIQLEVSHPWGEYYATNKGAMPPVLYCEALNQVGVAVDGISLKVVMGGPGRPTRDPMAISDVLDRYAHLDRPLNITAVSAPARPLPDAPDAGFWRTPWSPAQQADWLAQVFAVCLGKPYVQSVCWQELADGPSNMELPAAGLLDENGSFRPALERLGAIRQALKSGRSLPGLSV
jgi:hypothetical protein